MIIGLCIILVLEYLWIWSYSPYW